MKKIYYSYQIDVPATKDFPAHTVSNGAGINGIFRSYQESKDYLDIVIQDYPGATGKIFQCHETLRTTKRIEV